MSPSKKYRYMRPTCAPMLIQVPGRPHQAPGARALQHLQSQTGYPGRPSRTKCRIRCERRRAVDGPSRRDELQGVHTARMRSWQSGTEGESDRGPLIWGRWNGCAEGVERAQWVFGVRDVAWGCWWLCRAGGIKAGRCLGQVTFLAFQASRISF